MLWTAVTSHGRYYDMLNEATRAKVREDNPRVSEQILMKLQFALRQENA